MDRRYLVIAGLVFLVLLAGCADAGLSDDSDSNETAPGQEMEDETNETEETGETQETNRDEKTESTGETADTNETENAEETNETEETDDAEEMDDAEETTSEPWSEPEPPNTPLENNLEEDENRIKTVEAVTDDGADERTDSAVQLKITANTTMPDIDPAEYGTVRGEPFLLVYLNGSITNESEFSHANGTLVQRSEELDHEDEGEFELTIPQQAFEEAGANEGEIDLMVLLMDEDKDWDDIYGLRTITVEYSPAE